MQATQQMADAIEQSAWIQLFQSASSEERSRFGLDALRIAGVALDLGCRWVVTETGEAVAGAPNHSYNNMLRNRFTAIGSRDNYAPAGMEWDYGRAVAPRRLG